MEHYDKQRLQELAGIKNKFKIKLPYPVTNSDLNTPEEANKFKQELIRINPFLGSGDIQFTQHHLDLYMESKGILYYIIYFSINWGLQNKLRKKYEQIPEKYNNYIFQKEQEILDNAVENLIFPIEDIEAIYDSILKGIKSRVNEYGVKFSYEFVEAINNWQIGNEYIDKDHGKFITKMCKNLDPKYKEVDEPYIYRVVWWNDINTKGFGESVRSWSTSLENIYEFINGEYFTNYPHHKNAKIIILVTKVEPNRVIVNLKKLYSDKELEKSKDFWEKKEHVNFSNIDGELGLDVKDTQNEVIYLQPKITKNFIYKILDANLIEEKYSNITLSRYDVKVN